MNVSECNNCEHVVGIRTWFRVTHPQTVTLIYIPLPTYFVTYGELQHIPSAIKYFRWATYIAGLQLHNQSLGLRARDLGTNLLCQN